VKIVCRDKHRITPAFEFSRVRRLAFLFLRVRIFRA
jgi:hypothetical protein